MTRPILYYHDRLDLNRLRPGTPIRAAVHELASGSLALAFIERSAPVEAPFVLTCALHPGDPSREEIEGALRARFDAACAFVLPGAEGEIVCWIAYSRRGRPKGGD